MLTPQPEPPLPATPPPAPGDVRVSTGDPPVYLSARVPRSLRTQLQHQAITEGRPLAKLVQDAVRAYLDAHTGT
jgi:predicted GNAT superfamily acetyltransferase